MQLPDEAKNDLVVAMATVRFLRANGVCFAHRGQVLFVDTFLTIIVR